MTTPTNLFLAACRQDFLTFLRVVFAEVAPGAIFKGNWHHEYLDYELSRVTDGIERRLIINVPPRSLKSIMVTVAYTAWRLGRDPSLKIIAVSFADDLARKHASDFRRIIDLPLYQKIFPTFRIARHGDRLMEMVTSQNGGRLATSIGASVVGRGADLIVVDDPNKPQQIRSEAHRRQVNEYFDQALLPRIDNKQVGAIVIVMQRLHADDLAGHVLETGHWRLAAVSAIEVENRDYPLSEVTVHRRRVGDILQPERDNRDVLDELRATLGSLNFEAQYQQNPLPADGMLIKRSYLRYFDQPPSTFDHVIVSWDTALTIEEYSDWSVGTVWGRRGQDFYLLDVIRDQLETPELARRVAAAEVDHEADATIVERSSMGLALVQEMRRSSRIQPLLVRPQSGKLDRMAAQAAKFEAGRVLLPREAPWLAVYIQELLQFPNGRHDDQVDSTSQALKYLAQHAPRADKRPKAPRPIVRSTARPSGRIGSRRAAARAD